jgi:hypothetical protein
MKNNGLVSGLLAMVVILALALTGCDTGTGNETDSDTVADHDTETGNGTGGNTGTNVLLYAVSVQEKIDNNTTVTKNTGMSSSGKLVSAAYNTDTGNYTLLYKIGRINNLFSHYVTGGIPGGKGYGLTYTTNINTVSSTSLNTTVSASISAGVEAGAIVKSSVECTVGVSVSETKTIEQAIGSGAAYSYSFEKLDNDKLYAFAMFSMMDFYQVFTYNSDNGMATPILEDEKPLIYYDILDMFSYQICEYIPVNEIEFKTLEAWGSFRPDFSNEDNAKLDSARKNGDTEKPAAEEPVVEIETSSSVYVYDGDSLKIADSTGQVHTNNRPVGLNIEGLKLLGYTRIDITMDVQIRAHDKGDGRAIWFDIDNAKVWKNSNLNIDWTSWERKTYTQTVDIRSFNNDSVFRFGFENAPKDFWTGLVNWTDRVWWFNEATVTFSAAK